MNAVPQYGSTALMVAVRSGNLDIVRCLVDGGADVNAVNNYYGSTALMNAARSGALHAVQFLSDQGADLNIVENDGRTSLMHAAMRGALDVAQILVNEGAVVNAASNDGQTSLMLAASNGFLDVVRFLVRQGPDLDAWDRSNKNALMHATVQNKLDVVRFLVEGGADVNITYYDGRTALMYAAIYGNVDAARCLIDGGADMDAVTVTYKTALMYAAKHGKLGVVQLLVERGADANMANEFAENAAHYATKHGHIAIRKLLLQHIQRVQTDDSFRKRAHLDASSASLTSRSWAISPFDIELIEFVNSGNIGGEYRAKWLDADVVIKLFVPEASTSTFAEEVTVWHQLRHPNVIKLYGACGVGHMLFVVEYTSNGSLVEYLADCDRRGERRTPWKFLHEAALGLAYLHERKIVHGNLRGSNILVGSDGVAKLADFELTVSKKSPWDQETLHGGVGSARWQALKRLVSFSSDIYSLGLCVLEAVSGQMPWRALPSDLSRTPYWDPASDFPDAGAPVNLDENTRLVASRMCGLNPKNRVTAVEVVRMLERLAIREANNGLHASQLKPELVMVKLDEYKDGALTKLWSNVRYLASQHGKGLLYPLVVQEMDALYEQLVRASRPRKLCDEFYKLLTDLESIMRSDSCQNQILALSSTRATRNNLTVLRRRVRALWEMVDDTRGAGRGWDQQWEAQCKTQLEVFVSEVSQTIVVLNGLDYEEDRRAFIALLRSEIDNHASAYTEGQLWVMKQAFGDIVRYATTELVRTTPTWFLPWYELVIDKMNRLGEGGFGDVYRAKWLDSEVVVKQVKKLEASNDSEESCWTTSLSRSAVNTKSATPADDIDERKAMRAMFEREVEVWFGLSHLHVVRLFGVCHIGTPFFVCEYAGNGSLEKYLRWHPGELWSKLHEAALGVQYLQSRSIIHGDLKCNNIVVGNDGKAKVTDFGLSSLEYQDGAQLTGAWQWVAPECIENGAAHRSFASDVYALGMCIVEALRAIEFVKLSKVESNGRRPLPWGDFDNATVKYHVTKLHALPLRPQLCTDEQWELVERMCIYEPSKRIKISTVVDELAKLARGERRVAEHATPEPEQESPKTLLGMARPILAVIAKMKGWSRRSFNDASMGDQKVLCRIYLLLWERFEHLEWAKGQNAVDHDCLGLLVERAQKSTLALSEWKDTLVQFTEKALRGDALHRGLDKLIDAQFWRTECDRVAVHDWRPTCLDIVTGSIGEEYRVPRAFYRW